MRNVFTCLAALCVVAAAAGVAGAGVVERPTAPLHERQLEIGMRELKAEAPEADQLAMLAEGDGGIAPAAPLSANLGSTCILSGCYGSVCLGSGCYKSYCIGSVCWQTRCLGSICRVGSGRCYFSYCYGTGCTNTACGPTSSCVRTSCYPCYNPYQQVTQRDDESAVKFAVASPLPKGFAVSVAESGTYRILFQDSGGGRRELTVRLTGNVVQDIVVPEGSALIKVVSA